jgi:hypothetical protein
MLPSLLNDPAGRSEDGGPEVRATLRDKIAMAIAALSVVLPALFVALAAAAVSLLIVELWL